LALFGSAARNKMRKSSDIDVLVQFDKTTWANYIGLKFYLEDLLGREVDLITPKPSSLLRNHPSKKTCSMSSRNANLYLQDILQACDDILNFTQGMNSAADLHMTVVRFLQ